MPLQPMTQSMITASSVVRILLVEDCKSDVYLVERLLEDVEVNCFYEIIDVPRLTDAFTQIDQSNFDLVLLDLNLLDMDGITVVAALRAQIPHIPIVVYSGSDDPKMREKALMCGASRYLVKGSENGYALKQMIEQLASGT